MYSSVASRKNRLINGGELCCSSHDIASDAHLITGGKEKERERDLTDNETQTCART